MKTGCTFSQQKLHAWLDGEAGRHTAEVEEHLRQCEACAESVAAFKQAGEQLRTLVDLGVNEVEPLVALQKIRQKIADNQARTLSARLLAWWQDVLMFHRRALAGLAAAAALGALSAPAVVLMMQMPIEPESGNRVASVVVESMEVGGDATAVVLQGESGSTTLIWLEPQPEDRNGREYY